MRIRTQFLVTMSLFGVVIAIVSTSAIVTSQRVGAATEPEKIASSIAQGASELGYLSNDYLIYRESQQLSRWQARFRSFSSQVESLLVDRPEEQALVRNIESGQRRMKEVFDSIVSGAESSPRAQGTLDSTELQASWSRMAIQSQGLVADASRLSRMLRDRADQARQANSLVILSMIGAFVLYFLANYLIVQRRVLRSIAELKKGTLVIGSGALDFKIPEWENDEIGELSRAFNQMTASLKMVTASKTDLEREIEQRERAEEEREHLLEQVQAQNEELQRQSEEIHATNEELQRQSEEIHATNEELRLSNDELAQATKTAEEAVRARDDFLSVAAHELKTPVTSLRGFAQLLLRQHDRGTPIDPRRLTRALESIDNQSDKLASLVSKLLDISRLEQGRLILEREQTDIVRLVEEVAAAERAKGSLHDIAVEAAASSVHAFVDPMRIEQVVTNLVDNAIRYSPEAGPIEITVGTELGMVEIAVRDHGTGIASGDREHVFERFYRADALNNVQGLGLGLYISSEIVALHDGRIEVDCPPDGGTRFTVILPTGETGDLTQGVALHGNKTLTVS